MTRFNKDLFLFVISFKQTPSKLMDDPDGLNLTTTAVHVNDIVEWIVNQLIWLLWKVLLLLPCPTSPYPSQYVQALDFRLRFSTALSSNVVIQIASFERAVVTCDASGNLELR